MDQNWRLIKMSLKQTIFGNRHKSMNNQQNILVILWLTWQKYETMYLYNINLYFALPEQPLLSSYCTIPWHLTIASFSIGESTTLLFEKFYSMFPFVSIKTKLWILNVFSPFSEKWLSFLSQESGNSAQSSDLSQSFNKF